MTKYYLCVIGQTLLIYTARELAQRDQLYQKRMKIEAGVRHFENNNEEYAKIKKSWRKSTYCFVRSENGVKIGTLVFNWINEEGPGQIRSFNI
jgi:hypothetical protein